MKTSIPCGLLALLVAASSAFAQDNPEVLGSTTLQPQRGLTVTVRSLQSNTIAPVPAPEFGSLDVNHDGTISRDEAMAFAPLINDFDFADHNRSGRIERDEYQRWK